VNGAWTAKFLFVAANAWGTDQQTWLDTAMSRQTTYTFIVRHESASANTAPGVDPSEAIMFKHPYTLAIVGHTHTYRRESQQQIIIGNGGAPISGGVNYGFGLFSQRPDGAIQVEMIDYQSGQSSQQFAVKADGSSA
jgi:predicted phosphodiesterase